MIIVNQPRQFLTAFNYLFVTIIMHQHHSNCALPLVIMHQVHGNREAIMHCISVWKQKAVLTIVWGQKLLHWGGLPSILVVPAIFGQITEKKLEILKKMQKLASNSNGRFWTHQFFFRNFFGGRGRPNFFWQDDSKQCYLQFSYKFPARNQFQIEENSKRMKRKNFDLFTSETMYMCTQRN